MGNKKIKDIVNYYATRVKSLFKDMGLEMDKPIQKLLRNLFEQNAFRSIKTTISPQKVDSLERIT